MFSALRIRPLRHSRECNNVRILRMAALILVALVLAGTGTAAAAGSAATAGPAASGSPAACSGALDVTVTFSQSSYLSDQTITVNVNAVNCTGQTLTTHIEPYGGSPTPRAPSRPA